ncbi:WhiB family transcriptional regulator [Streptomyces varsoviensis]|uniref:WhiB family transcriptional regulator n=1 Tax=Streptomyces varsoviensis TaxID=67373 RepID=UPI0033F9E53A
MTHIWADDAACRDAVEGIFFSDAPTAIAEAKQICARCPVQVQCLAAEMEAEGKKRAYARFGVRGGLTPAERAAKYQAEHVGERAS